ncbi:MAG: hypothetical protein FJ077_08920 [Cyanobacteria bacterium K_DeepCast_35m_m2_023]|nr:hypothetical protein [Cyanobacteria bacterium K_DeepCast_35m_m2_023]
MTMLISLDADLLVDAVEFLLHAPSRLAQRSECLGQLDRLRQRHRLHDIQLVTLPRADGHFADHIILLRDAQGRVVKLSALKDTGEPWLAATAEPVAADTLLSVADQHLSIHSCLLYLDSLILDSTASFVADLEQRLLLQAELSAHDCPVDPIQLAREERLYRRRHGLLARQRMVDWLQEKGLSYNDFQELLRLNLRLISLRQLICEQHRAEWLASHQRVKRQLLLRCRLPPGSLEQSQDLLQQLDRQLPALTQDGQATGAVGLDGEKMLNLALPMSWLTQPGVKVEVECDWSWLIEAQLGQAVSTIGSWTRIEEGLGAEQRWCRMVAEWEVETDRLVDQNIVDELVFADWYEAQRQLTPVRWHWP